MSEITLSVSGLTIAGKTWGDTNLPPMLALHGWLDNANSFDCLAPYLSKHFHLIAVDLPGHGHSSPLPLSANYNYVDGAFIVLKIIKALGYKHIHLLGHSMGAFLASLAAGIAPKQMLSVSLIEALGPFSSPPETCREQLSHYLQTILLSDFGEPKGYSSLKKAAAARAKPGHVSLGIAEILCGRGVKKREGLFYWAHDRRLLYTSPLQLTETQVLSCLAGINVETTLILAEQGFPFPVEIMEKRIQAVKRIEVIQLAGGHHIHMETPEAVAQHLIKHYIDQE